MEAKSLDLKVILTCCIIDIFLLLLFVVYTLSISCIRFLFYRSH